MFIVCTNNTCSVSKDTDLDQLQVAYMKISSAVFQVIEIVSSTFKIKITDNKTEIDLVSSALIINFACNAINYVLINIRVLYTVWTFSQNQLMF